MIKLNPNLLSNKDPSLGTFAPIETKIFYNLEVKGSTLGPDVGLGVFAKEHINKGSFICVGGGQVFSNHDKVPDNKDYAGVLDERYFIAPLDYEKPTANWFINHSCKPNLKIIGRLSIIARRDIQKEEELTINYSVVGPGESSWIIECKCGHTNCRKHISNNDWKNKELFLKYYEEWPSFIQKKGNTLFGLNK